MVEAIDNFVFFASSVEFPKRKEDAFSGNKNDRIQTEMVWDLNASRDLRNEDLRPD